MIFLIYSIASYAMAVYLCFVPVSDHPSLTPLLVVIFVGIGFAHYKLWRIDRQL